MRPKGSKKRGRCVAITLCALLITGPVWPQVPPVGPAGCVALCSGSGGAAGALGGMDMGGLFGGLAMGLGSMLFNALMRSNAPTAQQNALEQQQEALRRAIEEQRRLQIQRHNALVASLVGAPDGPLGVVGQPNELGLVGLERSLSLLDGTPERDMRSVTPLVNPHEFWIGSHDAWFSTLGYGAQAASAQPVPMTDQALSYGEEAFESVECVAAGPYGGKLCPFPNMRPAKLSLSTLDSQPAAALNDAPDILSQVSRSNRGSMYSFQRAWPSNGLSGGSTPDLMTNWFDQAGQVPVGPGGSVGGYGNVAKQILNSLNPSLVQPGSGSLAFKEVPLLRRAVSSGKRTPMEVPSPQISTTTCDGPCWLREKATEAWWQARVWANDEQHQQWLQDAWTVGSITFRAFRGLPGAAGSPMTRVAARAPKPPAAKTDPGGLVVDLDDITGPGYMQARNRMAQKLMEAGVPPEQIMRLAPPRGTIGDAGNIFPKGYFERLLKAPPP